MRIQKYGNKLPKFVIYAYFYKMRSYQYSTSSYNKKKKKFYIYIMVKYKNYEYGYLADFGRYMLRCKAKKYIYKEKN